MASLDGIELADFYQRALAFMLDVLLAFVLLTMVLFVSGLAKWAFHSAHGDTSHLDIQLSFHSETGRILTETVVPVLYFGLSVWIGNGRTLGKRALGIRVVSLVHGRMSLWHSIERALGYAAAALEFGFGFLQFFIHPNRRTVQDRIAETIVVKEKSLRRHMAGPATD
jgi:uncharacterized RDD family membrane protein YckC